MKYIMDSNLHIRSKLSDCSDDSEQIKEKMLKNKLKTIFVTDCLRDETLNGVPKLYQSHRDKCFGIRYINGKICAF